MVAPGATLQTKVTTSICMYFFWFRNAGRPFSQVAEDRHRADNVQAGYGGHHALDGRQRREGKTRLHIENGLSICCCRVRVIAEKMMTYALGRGVEYQDKPLVRSIVRDAAPNKYRMSSLVLGIVKSQAFQMNLKSSDRNTQTASR